jgi:death-on-curing protein
LISLVEILAIHDRVVEQTGGSLGVRDEGGLPSALARPFQTFGGQDLYPTVFDKAGALLHSVCNNHPFVDGNKRTAIVGAAYLLHRDGIEIHVPLEAGEAFMLEVAQGRHDVPAIAERLKGWVV